MTHRYGLVLLFAALAFSPKAPAQNVTGYDAMPDPLLFLLREPAVHKDLGLSGARKQQLVEMNESFDAVLLEARNGEKDPAAARRRADEVLKKSRAAIGELLSSHQRERLRQIAYRLKGMPFVLDPEAAKRLSLTESQKGRIQKAVTAAAEKLSKVQSREFPGKDAQRESQRAATAARKQEQKEVLAALDNAQKKKLVELIGKPFDPASLGRVAFKAPELVDSGQWINSSPLEMEDLRGKVVALHFFAFG